MAQQKAVDAVEEVEDLIDELQPGAKLLKGQYTITRYLNAGGFGITYLAKDSLDRDVVIKECFPSSVCRRSKVVVAARSRAHTAELRSIVQLFVREARNLAKIVHPNIVAVHQVFEDNGTAYMAIDFIDGLDLQQIIDGEGTMPTPDQIVHITDKLLKAVGFIHASDMLHRDISPDNVLIDKSGEPILIDFGAAREQASKANRAMSALRVVKDGYSPQEFYIAGSEQGPWSDLYALAATLFHLISGEAPVNGQARLAALAEDRPDPYLPLTGRIEGYPAGYLQAIDRAMSTLPKQRVQSAADWLAMYHQAAPALVTAAPDVHDAVQRVLSDFQRDTAAETASASPLAQAASRVPDAGAVAGGRGKSPVQMVAGVAVALVVVAGGYLALGGHKDAPKVETTAQAPAPAVKATVAASVAPTTETKTAAATDTAASPAGAEPQAAAATDAKVAGTVAATPDPAPAAAPAPAPAAAPAATDAPAATAAAEPAATPEPAPTTTETTTTKTAATETAATETTAAPATAKPAAASGPKPAADQIAFAAWDVEMPFTSDDRMVNGKRVAIVTRISSTVDAKLAGDWLAPGVLIHSVNGMPIDAAGSLTVAVMNAMAVDPDGKARVVVEYSDGSRERKTGLLTVGAVRLVNLLNGVATRSEVVDGAWKTVVTGITKPDITSLRQGDTLFRDKSTTTALDGPATLESILGALVTQGKTETVFSVVRDDKVSDAMMQLTLGRGG